MTNFYHSPRKSTRRNHVSSRIGTISSVSPIRRDRRSSEEDILDIFQDEFRKIKPPNLNGEHRKVE
jgi:hypothetical protein